MERTVEKKSRLGMEEKRGDALDKNKVETDNRKGEPEPRAEQVDSMNVNNEQIKMMDKE
jgi:hypothetical protein